MRIVYAHEEPPHSYSKSIFLAGPTPRENTTRSWRPEALRLLAAKGYNGVVYVPEHPDADFAKYDAAYDYERTPAWEHKMLDRADVILFWIPRDLDRLPGFTTNIEYGYYANSGRCVLGAPENAAKIRYLKTFMAIKASIPHFINLENTIDEALHRIGKGSLRTGGERDVPLNIWRMRAFQNWYQPQKNAGNRLDGLKVEWISPVRNKPDIIFACALRPNVYITNEDRNKINDPIICRLDISTAVLYRPAENFLDTKVVITKEFRLSGSTEDGFIYELPGGSSGYITDPLEVVVEEISEEVDLDIARSRFVTHGARQLAGTFLTHKANLFSAQLTQSEFEWLESQKGIPHGADLDNPTGERVYTEIWTIKQLLENKLLDASNVGMILEVLAMSHE